MILGVHHVAISTPKPQALAQGLGFRELSPNASSTASLVTQAPNLYLVIAPPSGEAVGPRRAPRPQSRGLAHLCVQSPGAAALWESFQADGFVTWTAPLTGLGGHYRYAYGYTEDGLMLELEETPVSAMSDLSRWIAHVAFVTDDLARLAGFYAQLTDRPVTEGLTIAESRRAERITGLAGVAMTPAWVQGLNVGLEFWRFDQPQSPAADAAGRGWGYEAICLQTDDLEGDLARATALGAKSVAGQEPAFGGALARLRDPDGNRLLLLQLPPDHLLDVRRLPFADVLARHARAMEELS